MPASRSPASRSFATMALSLGLGLGVLGALPARAADIAAETAAMEARYAAMDAALEAHDVDTAAGYFDAGYTATYSGGQKLALDAILASWRALPKTVPVRSETTVLSVRETEDGGLEVMTLSEISYKQEGADRKMHSWSMGGTATDLWRQQDGVWKTVSGTVFTSGAQCDGHGLGGGERSL